MTELTEHDLERLRAERDRLVARADELEVRMPALLAAVEEAATVRNAALRHKMAIGTRYQVLHTRAGAATGEYLQTSYVGVEQQREVEARVADAEAMLAAAAAAEQEARRAWTEAGEERDACRRRAGGLDDHLRAHEARRGARRADLARLDRGRGLLAALHARVMGTPTSAA